MNASTLQSIGIGIVALIVVWGLYAAYVYVKISIAVQQDPRKRELLGMLIDNKVSWDGPSGGLRQVPMPMLGKPMTDEEMKAQRAKHIEAHRRRDRARDAIIILMGTAGTAERALELVEELEAKNATRPLPTLPTLDEESEDADVGDG